VAADIQAPPARIWALLTRPEGMTRWNSTLTSIEGDIELGGTVRMRVPEALPMIAKRLPDFGPIFERYAADLKTESERPSP